jgi:hypothetical protein
MGSSSIGVSHDDESVPRAEPVVAAVRRRSAVIVVAFTVAAIWIVATGGPFGRTQAPAASGPAITGPTVPSASVSPSLRYPPESERVGLVGLPPEGAVPSTPETGDLVAHLVQTRVGWVYVYADGRVIWGNDEGWMYERRLSLSGVDGVRSGAVWPIDFVGGGVSSVPTVPWADPEVRAYVPSTYSVCYGGKHRLLEASRVVGLLPARAQALLRGNERTYRPVAGLGEEPPEPIGCSEVTTEVARSLDGIFSDAGFEVAPGGGYTFAPRDGVGNRIGIAFLPLLPHGKWVAWGG